MLARHLKSAHKTSARGGHSAAFLQGIAYTLYQWLFYKTVIQIAKIHWSVQQVVEVEYLQSTITLIYPFREFVLPVPAI